MKYIYLILLPLFIFADTDIISEKEAFQSEDDIYWHIRKEIQVKDGLKIPLLFEFTKRGLGSLKLKDGMWLPIYDCNDNGGTRYEPCMMHQSLKDLNKMVFLIFILQLNFIRYKRRQYNRLYFQKRYLLNFSMIKINICTISLNTR